MKFAISLPRKRWKSKGYWHIKLSFGAVHLLSRKKQPCIDVQCMAVVYPDPGSNRDGLRHWCLRPARLPIPPSGLCDCKGTNNIFISQVKCEKSLSSIFFCLSIFASSREVLFPSATDCWLISSSSVTTSEIFQPYLFLTPYYNSSIRLCAIP